MITTPNARARLRSSPNRDRQQDEQARREQQEPAEHGQADNDQGQLARWSDGPRSARAQNDADDGQRGGAADVARGRYQHLAIWVELSPGCEPRGQGPAGRTR
jgi:hypothetical protein